ncbi:MOSC domain-containing protein [Thiohalobacter thiocyanaticus]|uniref:MOSC domain-containing protein n=1 Tax=Thiohalobacter thiocyanaticus TaxID=585455 RepID=A0A426QIW1_9GAMM|nr:MOSC domain-containing protein [Thiohalobacter thiocyanaticus]RRQ21693.1 MOSC domain-containing protein [Thiohalobacter thiocyanaticus]
MTMHILRGIYAGRVDPDYANGRASAITKQPLDGEVRIGTAGIAEDEQADPVNHGGPERALLHYSLDNYAWWQAQYPERAAAFHPPGFGENLSSAGLDERSVHIGDVYCIGRIGGCRLQVAQPRSPCWKLDVRFGVSGLAREVQDNSRCGWFYRVVEPGTLQVGDRIELLERLPGSVSIAAAMQAVYGNGSREQLQRLVDSTALAANWRDKARRRLEGRADTNSRRRLSGGKQDG